MSDYIREFEKLGFGLFVHFGLYSRTGRGEWYIHHNHYAKPENYEKITKKFKVKREWARELVLFAKEIGCKYINITTRHHDGFSLFDTKGLSDYDAPHSLAGRDLIREFVDECRKEEIVPFFYHTFLDWHDERYKTDFPAYIDYLAKSVELLCTNYGKIGGIWFDGLWDKPYENWQEDRIYSMIRRLQPEAMIINNTGLSEQGRVGHPEIDSVTFERGKPCYVDNSDKHRAGEMCQTLNDHWGYAKDDCNYKPPRELIENLVDCRRYNCNFLLNTGLTGNGTINETDRCILREVGKWVNKNGDFIYKIHSSEIKAEGAYIVEDGEYIYAVIKNVGMSADPNVGLFEDARMVKVDAPIKSAVWLDNGKSIRVRDNAFEVERFKYGESYSVRIAKLTLRR